MFIHVTPFVDNSQTFFENYIKNQNCWTTESSTSNCWPFFWCNSIKAIISYFKNFCFSIAWIRHSTMYQNIIFTMTMTSIITGLTRLICFDSLWNILTNVARIMISGSNHFLHKTIHPRTTNLRFYINLTPQHGVLAEHLRLKFESYN